MAPVFVFADHVRKVLRSGKKEIEIPAGARISAAAYDLIRDNKIRITHVTAEPATADAKAPETEDKLAEAEEKRTNKVELAPEEIQRDLSREATAEISAEALENIVDRVIERFKQLKGLKPEKTSAGVSAGVDKNADDASDDDLVICRCEEITRGEIKEAIRNGMRTLNGVKRITRAGMGLCQGQTCQRLVAQILSQELGISPADIDPTTARGPVRPLRLEVFANN